MNGSSNFSRNAALARGAVRADAPDVGAALDDRLVRVAELAGLGRAAGRVVLRVEVEDRPAAALVGEPVDRAGLVGEGDLGRRVAGRRACSCRERSRGLDHESRPALDA